MRSAWPAALLRAAGLTTKKPVREYRVGSAPVRVARAAGHMHEQPGVNGGWGMLMSAQCDGSIGCEVSRSTAPPPWRWPQWSLAFWYIFWF